MTNLETIKTEREIKNLGVWMKDTKEWNEAVKKDYQNTVKANPDKKYIFDPFVGYIERV